MTRRQPSASAKPTAEGSAAPKPKRQPATRGPVVLVVGLGNPGGQYARHRHNIGFMAVDRVADDHRFSPWRAKFQGEIAEARVGETRVFLLKPMTYMNESGRSVGEAARFLKVPIGDVIVLHDELDLAPGKVRVKQGGGHAGHNGLRSIHAHLGPDYARVRLGVGHPGDKNKVAGYVLHDFAKAEDAWLSNVLEGVSDGFAKLVAGDDAGFQNAVALKTNPPKPKAPQGPHQAKAAARAASDATSKAKAALAGKEDNPLARLLARFSR